MFIRTKLYTINIFFKAFFLSSIGNAVFFFIQGDGNFTLESANQIYVDKKFPLAGPFLSTLKDNFGAPAQNVDFISAFEDARMDINQWVEELTKSKIKDILPAGI